MAGEGSVFQRADGQWVAQLSLGSRLDRRYVRRVRPTRRKALDALEVLKIERHEGIEPSRRSLGNVLRSWLDETVTPNVTPNTARGYEDAIEHFAPIAHIALADLRADHIEAACNRMRASRFVGRGKPMTDLGPASPKTVRNAQIVLRMALEQAVERGHVRRNEAKLVKLRRVPRVKRLAMTPENARAVLRAIEGDRYEAAYALAMAALRVNEVLGLTVDDVNLDAGVVTIRHQLRGSGRRARLAPAKTPGSEETVDLPAFVTERVRRHVAMTDPVALLFTTEDGYAVNASWFTKHFQALLTKAGVERLTVHDLRSGAATLLAAAGAHPSVARDFLRHASETTTLVNYTRTTPEQRRQAAALLNDAVQGVTR